VAKDTAAGLFEQWMRLSEGVERATSRAGG